MRGTWLGRSAGLTYTLQDTDKLIAVGQSEGCISRSNFLHRRFKNLIYYLGRRTIA